MIYVGVDPGSRCTAMAGVDSAGKVLFVQAFTGTSDWELIENLCGVEIDARKFGSFLFAVEDQDYRAAEAKGSPQQLIPLAHVAGAAFAVLMLLDDNPKDSGEFVSPRTWKGTVPKIIQHRRTLKRLDWPYTETVGKESYCVPLAGGAWPGPPGTENITKTQWRDVLDAIGIALWLRDKHEGTAPL